jgi:hypothetical protein
MKEKDACKKELCERASRWVRDFLLPIFDSLIKELKQEGYQASKSSQKDYSLALRFLKGGTTFEYKILCVMRPPSSDWPKGRIDLNFSYTAENLHFNWTPFRNKKHEYDIEAIGYKEVHTHFYCTFRSWLKRT